MFWISILLVVAILLVITLSLGNRLYLKKGIGWQFIRFNIINYKIFKLLIKSHR